MKAKNLFHRIAKPIKGAEVAAKPRMHAMPMASKDTRKNNPQRMDLLRRNSLSSSRDDNNK